MRKLLVPSFILIAATIFAGCGGSKQMGITPTATSETIKGIPDWYNKPPQDPNFMFSKGTATSRDMQLAVDKASDAARMELAKAIETRFEGLSKRFQEEVGTTIEAQYLDQFTQATKSIVSQVLTGAQVEESEILTESGIFRAYVLMKMPVGASSEALLNKIKQQEQLYTRFRSTQVFDELNAETKKFEDWKQEQGR